MARRSDHTREELTQMAIRAGITIIKDKGFSEFSARAVASKMGYTVGTLYHLFGTLDEFILHINGATLDLWYDDLCRALSRQKYPPIQRLANAYIHFCRTNTNRWSALYEHRLPPSKQVPDWYEAKMDRLFTLVETSLAPYAPSRQIKRSARILWAGIHGICVLSVTGKLDVVGAESAEILAKEFVKKYLAGLKHSR